jgi:hypothetical protein
VNSPFSRASADRVGFDGETLIQASRLVAKVDSGAVQNKLAAVRYDFARYEYKTNYCFKEGARRQATRCRKTA